MNSEIAPDGSQRVGDYLIIECEGIFRVMEQFGSHRMIKTHYKTRAAAIRRAKSLPTPSEIGVDL